MIHGLFVAWPRAHMAGLKNAQAAIFSAEMLRAAARFSFLMADALDKASLSSQLNEFPTSKDDQYAWQRTQTCLVAYCNILPFLPSWQYI